MRPLLLSAATARLLRHLMVWVLVLALPVNGVSNTLLQVLGAAHRHGAPVESMASTWAWSPAQLLRSVVGKSAMEMIEAYRFQRQVMEIPSSVKAQARVEPLEEAHVHGQAPHQHTHGLFERHHHDVNDSTVIELGTKQAGHDAPGSSAGADMGAVALLVLPAVLARVPAPITLAWRGLAAAPWQSHVSTPLERPPRV